jgi:L-ribulose-5-phosphate 4-epimerase
MLKELKTTVCEANIDLDRLGLVIFTWGNASAIDRETGMVVIKPSGVSYDQLKPGDMVVVDLDGNQVDGSLNPSSDTPTHLCLYKYFREIGGIVHMHSEWATSWAQARRPIPVYGTTHADYFYGEIPCTRSLTKKEVENQYEFNTGLVIVETFKDKDPMVVPGVLVGQHGPFAWGKDPREAVHNARVLDEVAKMAFRNEVLGNRTLMDRFLLDKHYSRKHGKDAYYGQS